MFENPMARQISEATFKNLPHMISEIRPTQNLSFSKSSLEINYSPSTLKMANNADLLHFTK
jgi:hypothetical protein